MSMAGIGYIIRSEYLQAVLEKAPDERHPLVKDLFPLVRGLDSLERSFGDRLSAARDAAGIEGPRLSRAAQEAGSLSDSADREFHRLMARRCRRAATAGEVLGEILEAVSEDLALTRFRLEGSEDEPARTLTAELVEAKRELRERVGRLMEIL